MTSTAAKDTLVGLMNLQPRFERRALQNNSFSPCQQHKKINGVEPIHLKLFS
jgi:hypothetical protein